MWGLAALSRDLARATPVLCGQPEGEREVETGLQGEQSRGRIAALHGATVQKKSSERALTVLHADTRVDGHHGALSSVLHSERDCGLRRPPGHSPTPDGLGLLV